MKVDITRLPVLEAVIGFLLVVIVITFVGAFAAVDDESEAEEPAASVTPGPTDGGNGGGGTEFAVSMGDNFFDPNEITVPAGEEITFTITNDGSAIHNMVIAGADNEYNTDDDAVSDPDIVTGGQEATLTWTSASEPGEIDFHCAFHPTDMTGKITVE